MVRLWLCFEGSLEDSLLVSIWNAGEKRRVKEDSKGFCQSNIRNGIASE